MNESVELSPATFEPSCHAWPNITAAFEQVNCYAVFVVKQPLFGRFDRGGREGLDNYRRIAVLLMSNPEETRFKVLVTYWDGRGVRTYDGRCTETTEMPWLKATELYLETCKAVRRLADSPAYADS